MVWRNTHNNGWETRAPGTWLKKLSKTTGDKNAGGGGPTVSAEEALELGAIPGTLDFATGNAQWPQSFWD